MEEETALPLAENPEETARPEPAKETPPRVAQAQTPTPISLPSTTARG